MHPANYDTLGWGRERQAQLLSETESDRLAKFASDQEDAHDLGTLKKRRSRLLEALPGWTWARAARSSV
jgi:hypothetical protein